MRSNVFGGDGSFVVYPSIGGIMFLKTLLAVDLQYLGLPSTHDTARVPDEDDEFAAPMVKLGAQWCPNWISHFRQSSRVHPGVFYDHRFLPKVDVAFPTTGGVRVSNLTQYASLHRYRDEFCWSWLPHTPDLSRVKIPYALAMDNKAEMMKDPGGAFYIPAEEVSGLAKNVHETIRLFEPFKARLSNIKDDAYRGRLCTGSEDKNKETANEKLEKPKIWSHLNELR
ncbi:hypothetical protein BJ166DRAFT_389208 [Pestalotiopsis sp. NC0098]|nr:hypothetical protein BJ166DRAFT_389208 [Pestalotiopsis sp. NC0098]